MLIATAVAGIQVCGLPSRRRATSHWPVPMTAPAIRPPRRAEPTSSIRPTAPVARAPPMMKATKPAVHRSQALVLKRCWSCMRTILSMYDVMDSVHLANGTQSRVRNQGRIRGAHGTGHQHDQDAAAGLAEPRG